jgi:hypothetical protein
MKRRIGSGMAAAAALTAIWGCATSLRPAPEAKVVVSGSGAGAEQTRADVRVEARVDAWGWSPQRLERKVTPVLVKIRNDSRHELRVRYEEFALVDPADRRWSALPPFDTNGQVRDPMPAAYASTGFHVAPHLSAHYPYASRYPGAFAFDRIYYADYYPRLWSVQLPTTDMLTHALPEGVLDPGGRTAGFLYFERVEDPEQDRVDFRFDLVDARTQERFGRIEIPFVVR